MISRALQLVASLVLAHALSFAQATPTADARDLDHDGIADSLEQSLLEKFRPRFLISTRDCASQPAEFVTGALEPVIAARNGAVYGQVFSPAPESVEIHYFLLWDRDCGRNGHAFDVEHVSALLASASALQPETAKASLWYAGAHEDTVCDTSSATRASSLGAEEHGPKVWVSSGKHAMFLSRSHCGRGCGGDNCDDAVELSSNAPVINLGEPAMPLNGALWIAHNGWPVTQKMASDFPPEIITAVNAAPPEAIIKVGSKGSRATRAVILGGDASLDGIANGARHTGNALSVADEKASSSVGGALKKAYRWVTRAPAQKPEKK